LSEDEVQRVCVYKWNLVPGDGIEPPTRGFSIDVSKLNTFISIRYIYKL
jgi:hypothetical protein